MQTSERLISGTKREEMGSYHTERDVEIQLFVVLTLLGIRMREAPFITPPDSTLPITIVPISCAEIT